MGKPTFAPLTVKQLRSVDVQAASVRYDRQRPAGGRVRALDRLHEILVYNARLYEGPLQAKRDAVVNSIQAVRDYLADQGFAPATLEPINRPALALIERESNRSDPLFGRARAGAPKRSLALEHRTGAMAAIADQWLRLRPDLGLKQADKLRPLKRKLSGAFFGSVSDANIKEHANWSVRKSPTIPQ